MQTVRDETLKGYAFLGNDTADVMKAAVDGNRGKEMPHYRGGIGLGITSWEGARKAFQRPWPEGTATVQRMAATLREGGRLPRPACVRRKPAWNDLDGEVDVDRLLKGEQKFYRRAERVRHAGPLNIAVLLNVGGHHSLAPEDLFWRGAAAAAAIDLLEEAGYGCEVWCWSLSSGTFKGLNPEAFICWRVKDDGEPLDVDTLAKATSGWFYRTACIGVKWAHPVNRNEGTGHTFPDGGPPWIEKYMDVNAGVQRVQAGQAWDPASAMEVAEKILNEVSQVDEVSHAER